MYFLANEIDKATRKRVIVVSVCSTATYRLICNLAQPKKPLELTYAIIVKLLSDHYSPSQSVSLQHFCFNSRCLHTSEIIINHVAELRRLSEQYQFAELLDALLGDRLVCGMND